VCQGDVVRDGRRIFGGLGTTRVQAGTEDRHAPVYKKNSRG